MLIDVRTGRKCRVELDGPSHEEKMWRVGDGMSRECKRGP